MIVVLLGMFSVLIYKKLEERKRDKALAEAAAETDAKPDPAKPKPDSKEVGDHRAGGVQQVAATEASLQKTKGKAKGEVNDPFGLPSSTDLDDPPAAKGPAVRATASTPVARRDLDSEFDFGGTDTSPKTGIHQPAGRHGFSGGSGLDDDLPDPRKSAAPRSNGGHTAVASVRSPRTSAKENDLIDISDMNEEPAAAPRQGRVGGHSGAGTRSTPKAQSPIDEFSGSGSSSSDPFLGNDEPSIAKRDVKPKKSIPARTVSQPATTLDEGDAFDPTPVAKSGQGKRQPANGSVDDSLYPSPDKLGGLKVAHDPVPKRIPVGTSEGPSRLDADEPIAAGDPRLEGFEPVENTRTRASSRTMVIREPQSNYGSSESLTSVSRSRPTTLTAAVEPGSIADPEVSSVGPVPTPVSVAPRRQPTPVAARNVTAEIGHSPNGETYVFAPNDSFWVISRKLYGTARYFRALEQHNKTRVPDPSRIRPGTVIATPPREVLEKQFPQLIDKAPAATSAGSRIMPTGGVRTAAPAYVASPTPVFDDGPAAGPAAVSTTSAGPSGFFVGPDGQPMYRVGASDTLSDIAQRHLGRGSRYDEIYSRNKSVIPNPDNLKIGTVLLLPGDASQIGFAPGKGVNR